MATTATSASDSASRFSVESSMSRSRHGDSSPWMVPALSDAIHDDPSPSPDDSLSDLDNADKKPVWNKPSNSSSEVSPLLGAAESWPALSLSARPCSHKSPSFDSHGSMQTGGTPLNATSNASADSTAAAATSSENHSSVNGHRKPFRRNNNNTSSSSSTTNIPNATPFNSRDHHIHPQRASGTFRHSQRNRNTTSYPRADGNRRNFDHGNQTGFSHRSYGGRDMHLQPQRGLGIMRPQMLMGPPSFPASSAQYMAAPQLGSYGGPMLYPDYAQHVFMPHPPPEPRALVGPFPPLPVYYPSFDAMLYNKILTQVEYYFSADNLSRDEHLRDQMNDQGWVPVRVIAGFRRLAELTNNIQTILEALRNSEVVEIKGETIRRRGDWDKYLLPREPSKSGPAAEGSNNAALVSQLESMTLSEGSREGE